MLAPYQEKVAIFGGKGDTSRWMSPLKIFEYMAYGKAFIASDLNVLKEVLKHRYNSMLCPADDYEAWKSALIELQNNKDFAVLLGKNAREDVSSKYTWKLRAKAALNNLKNFSA
jgi:glycosyltransferase involved in cell wall biosynthesis